MSNADNFFQQKKNRKISMRLVDAGEIGAIGSSSFYHDSLDFPLRSTQQLKVDWSRFDRHTFFSSAAANVNVAFDKIINKFPFDGSQKDFEEFLSGLTGFEKYIFDSFPKHRGQLKFSGSYIAVQDAAGSLFPSLSKNTSGESVLSPNNGPFTIETFLYVPPGEILGGQIIAQKKLNSVGITLAVSSSASSVTTPSALFIVNSGSLSISASYQLQRGKFNHICATMEKEGDLKFLNLFVDQKLVDISKKEKIGTINLPGTQFLIGSGAAVTTNGGYFTPTSTLSGTLDEFRIFSDRRTINQQRQYSQKSLFASNELELYFKFNEPNDYMQGNGLNAIVLDSSGNSLHSQIQNFSLNLRQSAAADANNPFMYEPLQTTPILFPSHPDVVLLNENLLNSASIYDAENPNIITRLIPSHYLLEGSLFDGTSTVEGDLSNSTYQGDSIPGSGKLGNVQIMLTFLYMWAKFFDEIKLYVDNFSAVNFVDYETNETIPDNFLIKFLQNFGFDFSAVNNFNDANLQQYVDGQNVDYFISGEEFTLKNIKAQIMRRLLLNLQSIVSSKGTLHAVKSFFRACGLDPDTTFRIREHGGPIRKVLLSSKQKKLEQAPMISFISSSSGIMTPMSGALIKTAYLLGTRTEPGFPSISGNSSDGLFTSGSWTTELQVKYPEGYIENLTTQSLCRMHVTGALIGEGLLTNLIVIASESHGIVKFYAQPGLSIGAENLSMQITVPNFFDGTRWTVGFGRERNDAINSLVSSSYFLRVASNAAGDISNYYVTSSFFNERQNAFSQFSVSPNPSLNASGAYLAIGNEIIGTGQYFLNSLSNNSEMRTANFSGLISNLNFWSKAITEEEWKEHITNPFSVGVINPITNFDYEKNVSGSFEKLRLSTLNDINVLIADSAGDIDFIDTAEQNLQVSGKGFSSLFTASHYETVFLKHLSPYFDENVTDEKIRIYGFNDKDEVKKSIWSKQGPAFELLPGENQTSDDLKFSIEISMLDSLNRDIVNIMSTYESIGNAIGSPELLFSANYPEIEKIREVYFNKLIDKLDFKAFFEFYRWLDVKSFDILSQLLPKKTLFKGINFVVESHMLERHKNQYYYSNLYVAEADKKLSSNTLYLLGIIT